MRHFKNIDEVIAAVLGNKYGEEELKKFDEWIAAHKDNEKQYKFLKEVWEERSQDPKFLNADELSEKIWNKAVRENSGFTGIISNKKSKTSAFSYFLKIAAVLAIFVLTPYLFYHYTNNAPIATPVAEVNNMVSKSNPAGQKTRINLPDGSVVWLNSSSSISYPAFFSDTSRTIDLVGEAYFEVKKDSLRPFTVNSAGIYTTALGTSFNISAYPDQNDIQIGLITGVVSVRDEDSMHSLILEQNAGAIYRKTDRQMIEIVIDPEVVIAWKDGILRFDGEDFQSFIGKLEQWYGVKIIVEGEPPQNWRIRGKFADEYLTNILNSISFNKDFTYKINRKEVVFTFK